jgi:hypothetical protein
MSQLFPQYANALAKLTIACVVALVIGSGYVLYASVWSPYGTRVEVPRPQPVPFSHEHHVSGLGLDCRYCHSFVERSASAGFPPTETCMNCHSYVWKDSPMLAPVRESWRTRTPLQWTRVYDLPDFVFFNHRIHVAKGVGCETCHGRVDRMPITYQAATLYMKWCLECHKAPERYLRPRDKVFTMGYEPAGDQLTIGKRLKDEYHVRQNLTECYTCHR